MVIKKYKTKDSGNLYVYLYIVGAGSTGSVVANRLSETFKVLLLEAGGDPYIGTYTPGNALLMMTQPELQSKFQTVPQKNACLAMNI